MSLLTEANIKEIVDMWNASNENWQQSLKRWNDMQPEPDDIFKIPWEHAPLGTDEVMVSFRFGNYDSGSFGGEVDHTHTIWFDIPEHHRKPWPYHRHFELMAKYAEVAARRPDPWVEFGYLSEGELERFEGEITFYQTGRYEFLGEEKLCKS